VSALPRIPRDAPVPPRTIVLPAWLTPGYARRWLKRQEGLKDGQRAVLATRPKAGQYYSQMERYAAIAEQRDWNADRGYRLVWRESYVGRTFAPPEPAPDPLDESQAAQRFGELVKPAIMEGRIEADAVNALLVAGKGQSWGVLLERLETALVAA